MKMSSRSQKFAGVIQENVSPIIHRFLTPVDVGFLTVTAVEVSGDLEWVNIFVDTIGGKSGWVEKLNHLAPKIGHELSKIITKRRAFKIRFKLDRGNLRACNEITFNND